MTERCPSCSAAVRPGDPWCTLCFARLDEPQPVEVPAAPVEAPAMPLEAPAMLLEAPLGPAEPLPVPEAALAAQLAPAAVATAEAPERLPSWTCPTCHCESTLDELRCPTCGYALLAGPSALAGLPGPLRPGAPSGIRAGLMVGGVVACAVLFFAVFALVGAFL